MRSVKQWAADQSSREKRRDARARGLKFEDEIADYLRSIGFAVDVAAPVKTMMRIRGQMVWRNLKVDFFGCLDVMGIHPDRDYFLPIQATTARGQLAQKRRDMDKVKWNLSSSRPQIWIRGHGPKPLEGKGIPVSIFNLCIVGKDDIPDWQEQRYFLNHGVWIEALE